MQADIRHVSLIYLRDSEADLFDYFEVADFWSKWRTTQEQGLLVTYLVQS